MKAYRAKGHKVTEISIKMTPEQLREIADKMEEQCKNSFVEDSTVVAQVFIGDYMTISIGYDQENMGSKYQ